MDVVRSRWFALGELTVVALSCLLWVVFPGLSWQPLLLACLPWIARIGAGQFPLRRTVLDWLLVVFLLTAVMGLWTAYNQEAAWHKFWLLVAAMLLFYALAAQPPENIWLVAGLLAGLGVLLALFFVLANDWREQPADIGILNRLGNWFMSVRPWSPSRLPHANITAGILAMLTPFILAWWLRTRHYEQPILSLLALGAMGCLAVGLVMTSSRGAWMALAVALGMWLLWTVSGRLISQDNRHRGILFFAIILVAIMALAGFAAIFPGGVAGLAGALPGAPSGESRYSLAYDTRYLTGDFFWTGGGLASFAGLYSQYILALPFFYYAYSHNFYLDVWLEQGIFGFLALVGIMAIAGRLLLYRSQHSRGVAVDSGWLRWAVLASLIAVCVHGLVDSALYAGMGTPLLFVWAGMAVAVTQPVSLPGYSQSSWWLVEPYRWQHWLVGAAVAIAIVAIFLLRQPLAASWLANLGAVKMAQIELAEFPLSEWDDGRYTTALDQVEPIFRQALVHSQANRTAHHRLGLLAMGRRDFATAVTHLELAFQASPGHRGIVKNLGYSYVWDGELEKAAVLLAQVPEARREMGVYVWWWEAQDHVEFSLLAAEMVERLGRAGN